MRIKIGIILSFILILSCKEKITEEVKKETEVEIVPFLPFQKIPLKNLASFKEVSENWKVAGSVFADRSKKNSLSSEEGTGILVNNPQKGMNGNLFTTFEHGDIELEFDVMMPKESNSGIYFQGRYEVQLFDSWGIKKPKASDLGGIYQRWDSIRGKGKEGYDGIAPKTNAAKAPGLWQHFKIIFHAPKFDADGTKTKNAWFEEIWLNGVLVQENAELTGPTRAAAFQDEQPMGHLMIQGDHGPMALKNFRYKLYGNKGVKLSDMTMVEYENTSVELPMLDSLTPLRELKTDSISASMVSGERSQRILKYNGKMEIPDSGDYLFDFKVNGAGGLLLIDKDTVVNFDGDYNLDSLGLGKIALQKGTVPFTLVYNKHRPWTNGFSLEVEGPEIQKHALQAAMSLALSAGPAEAIMVEGFNEPIAQRSFFMHDGIKRTHCISVGTPEEIHYAYDLEKGSLLQVWSGDFLDATPMWHSRGPKQLGVPAGFTVSFDGSPEFANLQGENSAWPKDVSEDSNIKQLGYEFDQNRYPFFLYQIDGATILDKMIPSKTLRMLHRSIEIDGTKEVWHKVATGNSITKLPDGSYIVNDESYYIDFSDSLELEPVIRNSNGSDELLVKVPSGKQLVEYSIIW